MRGDVVYLRERINHETIRFLPELFTSQDCCSGKEVAHEAVVYYREWATTKSMQ
jgi:hypothetical protein